MPDFLDLNMRKGRRRAFPAIAGPPKEPMPPPTPGGVVGALPAVA